VAALSGHTYPLPRAAVNNLWEMSNARDLLLIEKKPASEKKRSASFDSARCV
jgi:hypothetical protein